MMKFRQKLADYIEAAKEQLESQIYDPSYDASVEDKLKEYTPEEMKDWEAQKAHLIQKDLVQDFANDIILTYEEIVAEKKLNSLREKMLEEDPCLLQYDFQKKINKIL